MNFASHHLKKNIESRDEQRARLWRKRHVSPPPASCLSLAGGHKLPKIVHAGFLSSFVYENIVTGTLLFRAHCDP